MIKQALLCLVLAGAVAACTKDSPTQPGGDTFVRAKAGTIYRYDSYMTDSAGRVVPGSRDTVVGTFLSTDGTIGGKSGVITYEERGRNRRDTAYFVYESNNNVSLLAGTTSNGNPRWTTIAVATGTASVVATSDTVEESGTVIVVRDSTIITSAGQETLTIGGASVSTRKINLRMRMTITMAGITAMDMAVNSVMNYAPSLGFFVRMTSPGNREPGGEWNNGSHQSLISYELK